MSRVGRKPIPLPSSVKIQIGDQLQVQGPKGTLQVPIPTGISVQQNAGVLEILRDSDEHAALHGLTRALAANAIQGVSPEELAEASPPRHRARTKSGKNATRSSRAPADKPGARGTRRTR